jgi:hypothetical protein
MADSWLHAVPKSLTVDRLVSPLIPVECGPEDAVRHVLERVAMETSRAQTQVGGRGVVIVRQHEDSLDVLMLDLWLENPKWLGDDALDDPVGMHCQPVTLRNVVDGATNFLDAMERLDEIIYHAGLRPAGIHTELLWVIKAGRPLGAVNQWHFYDSPSVKVAVLSFLLELEEWILQKVIDSADGFATALSADRFQKLVDRLERNGPAWLYERIKNVPADQRASQFGKERRLFALSMFIDKLEVARKKGMCLCGLSKNKAQSRDKRLEAVRNWCAHTSVDAQCASIGDLLFVVKSAREMIADLCQ